MFRRKRSAEDFTAEIRSHLELEADDLQGDGMDHDEAERRAYRAFGSVRAAQERFNLRGRHTWLDSLLRDLRFGGRSLRHSPGMAIIAVLTLALGVGANTAVFSVMNAVVLRSLPVPNPDRLVYLQTTQPPRGTGTIDSHDTFSYAVFDTLRKQNGGLASLMAYGSLSTLKVAVRYEGQPEEAEGDLVSGNFFSGLGVQIIRGRGFTDEDEARHAPIAVISYNYWTRRFARDPDVLGKTLYVSAVPVTIIGITAQGFEGLEAGGSTDFWIPFSNRPELNVLSNPPEDGKIYLDNPKWWCLRLIGRLAPGVTRQEALAQLQPTFQIAAFSGLGTRGPAEKPPVLSLIEAKSFPGYDEEYGKPLKVMMAMVSLILLIALSNIAMLLIARNSTRQREFSVRLALGAGRRELLRQLLTESLLLVVAGGVLAWIFALAATRALAAWAQIESSLSPDRNVLLFTFGLLILAAVTFGLAPLRLAVSSGAALALKTSAATANTSVARSRGAKAVVATQMALCLVLLVGGGLLVRTLFNLKNTPLGFPTDGLVVFGVNPHIQSLPEGVSFYRELMNRLRILPGVESVSIMDERIGSGWSNNSDMMVDGRLPDVPASASRTVRSNVVGPDFFHTLGVPVLQGRDFAESDTASSPHVGIINEEFARRFLPNQNPLGHVISPSGFDFPMTVIGVVKNHKYRSIVEDPIPMAWYMYAQIPVIGEMHVEMRVHGQPLAILPAAQKVVQTMDPNLPLIRPMTQRDQYNETISRQLMFARLAEFFGILAMVLVATGLYGTVAYRVNTRTAEIGVRMALGANRSQLVWMILRSSLTLTAIGVAAGVPLALIVARSLQSSLYGVKPLDGVTYLFAVIGLAAVALAASAVPAGRAASIDPLKALRAE
jgi:predicted permease